jgi:predicted RNase H-like nuclease (RuvC/YqgF family)
MNLLFLLLPLSLALANSSMKFPDELKAEDQQFYKNDSMTGNNPRERIDSTVKEINKLHGEIAILKKEMAEMKKDLDELKANKK